jgi:hypothetical protein
MRLLTDDHRILKAVSSATMFAAIRRMFSAIGHSPGAAGVQDRL